jgi:hypothetical protein
VMETALVPSMKREFVMFVEILKLERRFDKLFPFFSGEGLNLASFLYVVLYVILLGLTA